MESRRQPGDFGIFYPLVEPCGRLGYAGLRYREPALFARTVIANDKLRAVVGLLGAETAQQAD